jgi:hypothetical protein
LTGCLKARYDVSGETLRDRYFDSDWLPFARKEDHITGIKNLINRLEEFFKAEGNYKGVIFRENY